MNMHTENEIKDESKRDLLYKEFKKNKNLNEEISLRNKAIEDINASIKELQEKASSMLYELNILQEIKNSQKTFVNIDSKISLYLENLKENNNLNNWKNSFSTDNENTSTNVYSIKNATYTGAIIVNQSKKRNFYRVDFELSLASILLNFAKEYKLKFQSINDVVIKKEGKVLYNENDKDEYILNLKEKYKKYFIEEKSSLLNEFKDINRKSYKAIDFIEYDDMLIDGYNIIENDLDNEVDEIPF